MRLLEGTRVLSLEQYIAGPYCTSLLADAGAEVIKVEQPGIGDPRRQDEPRTPGHEPDINAGYVPYNRGKKSIVLPDVVQHFFLGGRLPHVASVLEQNHQTR